MIRLHFITLSRSDYASTKPIIQEALKRNEFDVEVTAGGSHLLERFGRTINDLNRDGIPITHIADFLSEDDNSDFAIAKAYSKATECFFNIFSQNPPDLVFILGDRWEMQAVATVAAMMRLPIVHHSGGDITEGSADNQTRYLLSTLAHLHFTALPEHSERLKRMGEEDWRVHTCGEPALLHLQNKSIDRDQLYQRLGLPVDTPFCLATFHPTTYDDEDFNTQIDIFLTGLDAINMHIVLTAPNPDPGSQSFYAKLKHYESESNGKVRLFESLGAQNYYGAMATAKFMIGNSSSGLWEAPSFKLPVINMGKRQDGRVHDSNVVNTKMNVDHIRQALNDINQTDFKKKLETCVNPYVRSDTLDIIFDKMHQYSDKRLLLAKKFIDPLKA